jgi:hypothetical protein
MKDTKEYPVSIFIAAPKMYEALKWFMQPDHPIGSDPELIFKFEDKIKPIIEAIENT